MYEERILAIAGKLRDRMDPALIGGALNFLEHNEARLGFEILCDNVCEDDVPLTNAEYLETVALGTDFSFDLD
ncbi:hypothetical protein D3C71_1028170 [compost metagenome]